MDTTPLANFRLNGRTVDLQRGSVTGEAGHLVTLRPQAAEVLKLLAARPGKLVSKNELMQMVWGSIAVTDDSLVQCITEIRKALGDEKHEIVRTVLKRGYMLEASAIEDGCRVSGSRPAILRRGSWAAIAVGVAILVAAVAAYFWPVRTSEASRPAIAVMPFDNLGGDDATGRLADGITEEIITDLARFRHLDVIARNSTMAYKGKAVDVRRVGTELNVQYMLEGSIQRQDARVRVSAQFINATTGAHLWSERWDRPAADVFAVQTELAERTVNALAGYKVLLRESRAAAKRKRPTDLDAYDLHALAYEAFMRGGEAELERGLRYANAAIARDPGFVRAYAKKFWILNSLAHHRKNWKAAYAEMERLARTATEIDPYDAEAYVIRAFIETLLGRFSEAEAATNRALELNPSSADILNHSAVNMPYLGRPEEGLALCERAFRLNPNAPEWYFWNCMDSYFFTRRFQATVDAINRWDANHDLNHYQLIYRAASETELGRDQDAAATKAELRRRYPEISFEFLLNTDLYFKRKQEEEQMLALVRKAGIRICATEQELRGITSPRRLSECIAQRTN